MKISPHRFTAEVDRTLDRLGRIRSLTAAAGSIIFGAVTLALVVTVLGDLSSGLIGWGDVVGSTRRGLPAVLVVFVGGPFALLMVFYGVFVGVRLQRLWADVPRRPRRR